VRRAYPGCLVLVAEFLVGGCRVGRGGKASRVASPRPQQEEDESD